MAGKRVMAKNKTRTHTVSLNLFTTCEKSSTLIARRMPATLIARRVPVGGSTLFFFL